MTDLENNLRKILYEKNVKIIPENIKEGIDIFGIEGIIPSDITTFEDYKNCMIIANSITDNINPEKILSEATYSYTEGEDFTNIAPIDTGVPQSDLVNGYTLFATVKPTDWTRNYGLFGYHGGNNQGILFQYNSDKLEYGFVYQGIIKMPLTDVPVGEFTLLTFKYYRDPSLDISRFDVYINGILKYTLNNVGTLRPLNNVILGNSLNGSSYRQFHGIIDNFYVFDSSLEDVEIIKINNYLLEHIKEV